MIDKDTKLSSVRQFKPGIPTRQFRELTEAFPTSHFERLFHDGFPFYRTTFWYPLDRAPENVVESAIRSLQVVAEPASDVIGVEWWFSIMRTNATPQWLLPCHFDRSDLSERDVKKMKHPEKASVLFLNTVSYGELVVTDQLLTADGTRPKQPREMVFIRPRTNVYAVFPGTMYHGVIGRMWRPIKEDQLRITMAVNWWAHKPEATYLADSRDCLNALRLSA